MRDTKVIAIAAVLLSAMLSACGEGRAISYDAKSDELSIVCDGAGEHEAAHIGGIPAKDGEVLCVKGQVQRGSVEVVFKQGTRKITATLDEGYTPETIACEGGGDWSVDVESMSDGTKGSIQIFKRAAD